MQHIALKGPVLEHVILIVCILVIQVVQEGAMDHVIQLVNNIVHIRVQVIVPDLAQVHQWVQNLLHLHIHLRLRQVAPIAIIHAPILAKMDVKRLVKMDAKQPVKMGVKEAVLLHVKENVILVVKTHAIPDAKVHAIKGVPVIVKEIAQDHVKRDVQVARVVVVEGVVIHVMVDVM